MMAVFLSKFIYRTGFAVGFIYASAAEVAVGVIRKAVKR